MENGIDSIRESETRSGPGAKSLTRRELLGGLAGAATALVASQAGVAQPGTPRGARKSWDVVVVGAGVFGAWSAWNLLRKGKRVLLLDARGPANERASSGGESRMTRAA